MRRGDIGVKKRIKTIMILIISIFIVFSFNIANAYDKKQDYAKEYKENIYNMAKIMRCIPKTGDISLDYLYEMALLSEAEVDFSEAYVKYASNEEIKKIAQVYVEREGAALENMKAVIERLKNNLKKNEEVEENYLKVYNEVLNEMICKFQKVELTEDINIDFLKFIVIHHNGVIRLTEEFLKVSNNYEIKEIANKLNDEMKNDINIINKYI